MAYVIASTISFDETIQIRLYISTIFCATNVINLSATSMEFIGPIVVGI